MVSLSSVWVWVGDNSGQIQIIIALGAIWLAFEGYKKVLEQINISTKQEERANEQRDFELKIQALSLLLTALDRNHISQKNLNGIIEHLETSIGIHVDKKNTNEEDFDKEEIEEVIKSSKFKIKEFQAIQELIISLCDEINKREAIDQKSIKLLYEALLGATKDAHSYELINQIFRGK